MLRLHRKVPVSPATRRPDQASPAPRLLELMTRERWIEVTRIGITAIVILLYSQGLLPLPVLFAALAFGLYPLVKIGLLDLIHERKR